MRRLSSLWPAGASALLLLLAFPPFNLGFLVFVALVPLLSELRKSDPRRALTLGYALGFVYMLGQMQWLQVLVARWTQNVPLSFLPWVLCGAVGALYFALFGWFAQRCYASDRAWLIPFVWAGIEVFRSYIPVLAFPWALIATPLWPYPSIIQTAAFGTIFFVGAWVVIPNLVIATWLGRESIHRLRPLVMAFAFLLLLSIVRYSGSETTQKVAITVGQTGVDMAFGDPDGRETEIKASVERLFATASLNGSKLLVLPEGVAVAGPSIPPNTPFEIPQAQAVVFGARRGDGPVFQSAFGYDGTWTIADKTRLVIFGEFVPGRDWIPFLSTFNLPSGDLAAGSQVGTLNVAGIEIAPTICFEALFPDIAYRQAMQGSQVLAVLSIDDWYMGTGAPEQLMAGSMWRAVETGLPMVRSASQGHTLATDSKGRILSRLPLRDAAGMRVELPVAAESSTFAWLPAFPILSLIVSLYVAVTKPRREGDSNP